MIKQIRELRADDAIRLLFADSDFAVFFTLTTPDVIDLIEIRERWRGFRHYLVERFGGDLLYIMNFELHPKGHGWHIHTVMNKFIPLKELRQQLTRFGFGRVDVRKVDNVFVSLYLTKHCLKAYRGIKNHDLRVKRVRLVNQSRSLPALSNYSVCSAFQSSIRANMKRWRFLREDDSSVYKFLRFSDWYLLCEVSTILNVRPDSFYRVDENNQKIPLVSFADFC